MKSAHTEASAEACGARPGCPPRAPASCYSPARIPPAPPAPPLSLALAEPSGSALRAPCATQCCSITTSTPRAPDLPEVRSRGSLENGPRCAVCCSITVSTRPPGLLDSPKSHLVRSRGSLDLDGMGRGVRVRAVPGCVVALYGVIRYVEESANFTAGRVETETATRTRLESG